MRKVVLVVHNVRSCHNVGSLLRTADGLGVSKVYLTGYTPYPINSGDNRIPHEAARVHKQIQKTALGAEETVEWQTAPDIFEILGKLKQDGFLVAALEQHEKAVKLPDWQPPSKVALIVGRETDGIEEEVLEICDLTVEIPMSGSKESFNVAQAAAMALYHCRFL